MIEHRPAWPDEFARAAVLCPGARPGETCFLAVSTTPVERILAAAFYADVPHPLPGHPRADFIWSAQPRHLGTETEQAFLTALAAHVSARLVPPSVTPPGKTLRTRALFPDSSASAASLARAGFAVHSVNQVFTGDHAAISERVARLAPSFAPLDASVFSLADPAPEHAPDLIELISQREGLLSAAEIEATLRSPQTPARAFDTAWSSVLIESATGRVIGAQLVRHEGAHLHIPALAVLPGYGLPGHALYLLFARLLARSRAAEWAGRLRCRINPDANPIMLRLGRTLGLETLNKLCSYAFTPSAPPLLTPSR